MVAVIVHVKIRRLEFTAAVLLDSRSSLMGRHVKVNFMLVDMFVPTPYVRYSSPNEGNSVSRGKPVCVISPKKGLQPG